MQINFTLNENEILQAVEKHIGNLGFSDVQLNSVTHVIGGLLARFWHALFGRKAVVVASAKV
jgi:hypothetical protein